MIDKTQLQIFVSNKEDLLSRIFDEAISAVAADQGFLAFVDAHDHQKILVQKGEYWHLPSNRGVAGQAFSSGKIVLVNPSQDAAFRDSGVTVFSEIAVPLQRGEEVVGVLLLDYLKKGRSFGQMERDVLERIAGRINSILDEAEPWGFRAWWARDQSKKREQLLLRTVKDLKAGLRQQFAQYGDMEIAVAQVDEHRRAGNYAHVLAATDGRAADVESERDPLADAIIKRRPQTSGGSIPRYVCFVPFPLAGPVMGVVRLESSLSERLGPETVTAVQEALGRVQGDPLSVAASDQPDDHFYINFVQSALTAHLAIPTVALMEVLGRVAEQAGRLCASDVRIVCNSAAREIGRPVPGSPVEVCEEAKLRRDSLPSHGEQQGNRYFVSDDWISCPVSLPDQTLVAVVRVARSKEVLDDLFNTQVIESAAVLLGCVVTNFQMRAAFGRGAGLTVAVAAREAPHLPTAPSRPAEALQDVGDWLGGSERLDLDDVQVVGGYLCSDRMARAELKKSVEQMIRQAAARKKPFPVLLCARPGVGKTFFVEQVATEAFSKGGASIDGEHALIRCNLSAATDIPARIRKHFKQILLSERPRVGLMDEVDTTIGQEHAYRFLLEALEGGAVDIGDDITAPLPGVLWFFTASKAHSTAEFEAILATQEKGTDWLRRFRQAGTILELPALDGARDTVYQVAANVVAGRPTVKGVEAAVLFYFAATRWRDSGDLKGAVRTVVTDMGDLEALRVGAIADRPDFHKFSTEHAARLKALGARLIEIRGGRS